MNALKRTWGFMQPYNLIFFLMVVTVILPVLMELTVPRALRYVIDSGIEMNDMDAIFRGVGVMLLAAVLGAIATLGQGVCRARLSQGLAYDMREELFAHIQSFSFANLDTMQTGELMTRMTSDVRMVRMFMSAGLALLLLAIIMIVGSVTMMIILDWQLALIMLIILPIAGVVIAAVMVTTRPMFSVVQQK